MTDKEKPKVVRLTEEEAGLLGLPSEWVDDVHAEVSYLDKGERLGPATMAIALAGAESTTPSAKAALVRKVLSGDSRLRRSVLLLLPEGDESTAVQFEDLGIKAIEGAQRLGERALGHIIYASDVGRLRASLAEI